MRRKNDPYPGRCPENLIIGAYRRERCVLIEDHAELEHKIVIEGGGWGTGYFSAEVVIRWKGSQDWNYFQGHSKRSDSL